MTEPSPPSPGPQRQVRCWTLCSADGSVDVEVLAQDGERLGAVVPSLERALGVSVHGLWSGSSRLADDLPLTAPELAHAATLGLGRPGPRPTERSSALELHVVGGPEAGRTVPLSLGRHVLGRGAEASLHLDDPDVSRRHARIDVGGGRLTVTDLGSTNGSRLDDTELVATAHPWPAGAVLRIGASALTVRGPESSPAAVERGSGGRARVRASARMVAPRPEVEVVFPRPPAPPPRRRLAWLAVALPALAGVVMAWLLSTPQFLFFGLLSPVVALGTWLSERWSGRRAGRRDAAAHVAAVLDAEARLAAAVQADRRAAEVTWPDQAAVTTAARRRTGRLWERRRTDSDALQVRVGSASGTSRVTRVTADGARVQEPAAHLPVVVDLRETGGLAVIGPRARTTGVLSAVLGQVVVLHGPEDMQLALLAQADRLADWEWLRWLPHLRCTDVATRPASGRPDPETSEDRFLGWLGREIAARRAVLDEPGGRTLDPRRLPWLLVLVDRRVGPRVAAAIRAGRAVGVVVLTSADVVEHLPVPADAALQLSGETGDLGLLRRAGLPERSSVVVDRLTRPVASALARDLAPLTPASAATSLPRDVRLLDLPFDGPSSRDGDRATGRWTRVRGSLVADLGRTADGVARVDLCRQGPHVLVAGTTGSGKSELLKTLIAGLALHHPPDRCSFLLIDYKGGAAFAAAVELPHTVGLVTDLDAAATERALRSLGAELTRRESLLAAQGVSDVSALPDTVDLARLVIVVDEFATLAEEHPSFVPGLIGIAQRGRSLGVHLVLATQRPGGVVSPEIRANCSLRICLRTTDEADSRDVIGTGHAAFLPVDLPGRAYLRTGTEAPVEVQVARVAGGAPSRRSEPVARRWSWPDTGRTPIGPDRAGGPSDLGRLTEALRRHALVSGIAAPHRPWQPPLPPLLSADALERLAPAPPVSRLRLGLVDRPDAQRQEPLELDLGEGGGWLVVGGARSGRTTFLRTVLAEAVSHLAPDALHVHVLDHGGGGLAAEAAALPHAGTTVGADDPWRTVRLVERLTEEIASRRGSGGAAERRPAQLLLVDGVESVSAQLDECDLGRGSATLLRLVRDGAAVGLTCVLTADRAVPGGRLATAAAHRLVLPLPDRADYAVAGVPTRAVPDVRPPGRALLGEAALECQLAMPRAIDGARADPPAGDALRIVDLAPDPVLPLPRPTAGGRPTPDPSVLAIGPGGDAGGVLSVDLRRTRGLLVVGPPGSGRTSTLDAFIAHLAHSRAAVLRVTTGPGSDATDPVGVRRLDATDPGAAAGGLAEWLATRDGRLGVVVVDDLAALADSPVLAAIPTTGLPTAGAGAPVAVVASGSAADLARLYQGPVATLRRSRSGLLLTPGPGDADLLGIRLPRAPLPLRPGSGWLVAGGAVQRVQVARRRTGA